MEVVVAVAGVFTSSAETLPAPKIRAAPRTIPLAKPKALVLRKYPNIHGP